VFGLLSGRDRDAWPITAIGISVALMLISVAHTAAAGARASSVISRNR